MTPSTVSKITLDICKMAPVIPVLVVEDVAVDTLLFCKIRVTSVSILIISGATCLSLDSIPYYDFEVQARLLFFSDKSNPYGILLPVCICLFLCSRSVCTYLGFHFFFWEVDLFCFFPLQNFPSSMNHI